jgi:hypothetical protein
MKCIKCTEPISETLCSLIFFRIPDNGQSPKENPVILAGSCVLLEYQIVDKLEVEKGKAIPVTGRGDP